MESERMMVKSKNAGYLRVRLVMAKLREGSAMAFALGRGSSPAAVANGLKRGQEREKMGLGSAL